MTGRWRQREATVGLGGLGLSAVVALADGGLRHAVGSGAQAGVQLEPAQEAGTPIGH